MKSAIHRLALVSLFVCTAALLFAQERPETIDPSETARFRWGPLRFTPGIALTDIGVDSNVFNTVDDQRQDTTAAVGPAVNFWAHLQRARVTGKSSGQYLYFKTYDNQRGWNTTNELEFDLPLARLRPFVSGSYINTRERPGYEIDSRSRAATNTVRLGTDLRVSGKTIFTFSGSRTNIAFDQNDTFLASELARSLNRREDAEEFQFRYGLTPLTTLVVKNEAIQDRFSSETGRNADSIRVMPGFLFKPLALISGSAFVGFRHFNALNDTIADFNGLVAKVDAQYVVAATRLQVKVGRDVVFSYEDINPYYKLTDVALTLTQRVTRSWDIVGRGGWQSLEYQQLQSSLGDGRTDRGRLYGGGAGYRFGEALRLGLDVNYLVRRSPDFARQYNGVRVGASVSYGIPQ
jgi:Putative beta-barrel porin 2